MAIEKISTKADEKLWEEVKNIAEKEGKYVYTLVNEAFSDLIQKRKQTSPRKSVIEQFAASVDEHQSLYQKLAK